MGILTKGDNAIFLNSAATLPMLFLSGIVPGANNTNAAAQDGSAGEVLQIGSFARIYRQRIVDSISAARPQAAKNMVLGVDSADATQIDLAVVEPGKVVRFCVETELVHGQKIEFYRAFAGLGKRQYGRTNFFSVKLRTGDTAATVLQRLQQAMNDIPTTDMGEYTFKAEFAAGKLTLTGKDPDYFLKLWAFDKIDIPSTAFDVFAPSIVTEAYEGLNLHDTLHAQYGLQTEASTEAYSLQQWVHPVPGMSYTSVQFYTSTERPDLVNNELSDSQVNASKNTFTIFVAKGNEAWLTALLTFLNRAPAGVTKTYFKSDGSPVAVAGSAATVGSFLADV